MLDETANLESALAAVLAARSTIVELRPPLANPNAERQEKLNADTAIRAIKQTAAGGFPAYAQRLLKIRSKSGTIVPFTMNAAQLIVQQRVDAQVGRLGYVRQLVLKGRQMGISTVITGRGYYRTSRRTGQQALTIAHEMEAAKNLHGMIRTFHDFMDPRFKPRTKRSNEKELLFDGLRSSFTVATAKNLAAGRSKTAQHFHGSEVAYWPDAAHIMSGAMQAIGTIPDTEVWLESTAQGIGNYFHSAVQFARKAEGDFELIFLPWFIDLGYTRTPATDFEDTLDDDDRTYMQLHGLTLGQMAWRAAKVAEFAMAEGGDKIIARVKFGAEYPATIEEAFNTDTGESFIRTISVLLARHAGRDGTVTMESQRHAPLIMGIDPSWKGNDKFSVWLRRGRVAKRACPSWKHKTITESVGRLLGMIQTIRPDAIHVDANGVGAGVYDLLVERLQSTGLSAIVSAVMAGSSPEDDERYVLKRDECWGRMKDWLSEPPQVAIDDDDAIQADLTSITNKPDSRNRTKLESKLDMRKRGIPSPDDGDALSLTFAYAQPAYLPQGGRGQKVDPNRPYNWRIGVGK